LYNFGVAVVVSKLYCIGDAVANMCFVVVS
jgi:hypothetical protein